MALVSWRVVNERRCRVWTRGSGSLSVPGGYVYAGTAWSGEAHFAKLVHDGIEFGTLQAIAEGVDLPKIASRVSRNALSASWTAARVCAATASARSNVCFTRRRPP